MVRSRRSASEWLDRALRRAPSPSPPGSVRQGRRGADRRPAGAQGIEPPRPRRAPVRRSHGRSLARPGVDPPTCRRRACRRRARPTRAREEARQRAGVVAGGRPRPVDDRDRGVPPAAGGQPKRPGEDTDFDVDVADGQPRQRGAEPARVRAEGRRPKGRAALQDPWPTS